MLQIRKIKPEDIKFVLELAKENNYSDGKLLSSIEGFLICESGSIKCGCGCMVPSDSGGLISWVMVAEGFRGQKLGSAITKALLNIADINGIKDVYAAAQPTAQLTAQPTGNCGAFLRAMGFEKTDNSKAMEDIRELLGVTADECYHVALEGYFKPCSQK